jgi:sugar phosphate isomerase/epimerase
MSLKVLMGFLSVMIILCSCQENKSTKSKNEIIETDKYKYSLGQWSFHKELFAGDMTTEDFIITASELGFDGLDYVNQFFRDKAADDSFLQRLKFLADSVEIENVMILVDIDEDLGDSDKMKRNKAIEQHKSWLSAAYKLGCSSIRVNARGNGPPERIQKHCTESIRELAVFASEYKMDILIENHGGISNNGAWLASLISDINKENVQALADFDNWCVERENGKLWGAPCTKEYDRYQGMQELLPLSKGISAKSFEFDELGNEINIDFKKMAELIKESGYSGYIGVEFEGEKLSPKHGIEKTMELIQRVF